MAADGLLWVWDERHSTIGVAHDLVGVEHSYVELLRKLGELREHACKGAQVSVCIIGLGENGEATRAGRDSTNLRASVVGRKARRVLGSRLGRVQ